MKRRIYRRNHSQSIPEASESNIKAGIIRGRFDRVEFIFRRPVEAAHEERAWLDEPRGRDRLELIDPNDKPADYPPSRPQPLVYNETWDLAARNAVLRAD